MSPSVADYYAGKSVLITGATGFLGKVLVEKFLRSCPDLDTVYVLLREKKGVSSEERLKELSNNKLFLPLKEKNPDALKKLKLIAGDVLEEDLGLSNDDREELEKKCNMVFHSAACVRFDMKLKQAVRLNVTGTWRVLKLCETMLNLEVMLHLSTAYNRCELEILEEKLYPAKHNPKRIMDIVEWMDDATLDYLEPRIIGTEPNTYSYTKAITEELVAEYAGKFPVAIARPSIVVPALKEPIPGWVDNLNGPTGLIIGGAKGVIRTMHCEPSYSCDAMPVDIVVNACVLCAYATGIDKPKDVRVYNLTLSGALKNTWGDSIERGKKWINEYPLTVCLWYPGGSIKSYWWWHQICLFFTHIVPAYLVDMLLFLLGKKTFMVNVQKRISHGLNVLQFYTTKEWNFVNTNFVSLRKRISERDNNTFFTDVSEVDTDEFIKNYIIGARYYCCKEDPSNLERARKLHKVRYWVDKVTKFLVIALCIWVLYLNRYFFTYLLEALDSGMKYISPAVVKAEIEEL